MFFFLFVNYLKQNNVNHFLKRSLVIKKYGFLQIGGKGHKVIGGPKPSIDAQISYPQEFQWFTPPNISIIHGWFRDMKTERDNQTPVWQSWYLHSGPHAFVLTLNFPHSPAEWGSPKKVRHTTSYFNTGNNQLEILSLRHDLQFENLERRTVNRCTDSQSYLDNCCTDRRLT